MCGMWRNTTRSRAIWSVGAAEYTPAAAEYAAGVAFSAVFAPRVADGSLAATLAATDGRAPAAVDEPAWPGDPTTWGAGARVPQLDQARALAQPRATAQLAARDAHGAAAARSDPSRYD